MSRIKVLLKEKLTTICEDEHGNQIMTDAPKVFGGLEENFNPTDLAVASLGACILTVMGIYAAQLGVSVSGSQVVMEKTLQQKPPRRIEKIVIEILVPHTFSEKITQQLEQAAEHCPVHMSLHPEIEQLITFKWGYQG